jgi:thioredoxin-like negative regulator of GroEL
VKARSCPRAAPGSCAEPRLEDARRILAALAAEPANSWLALSLAELHAAVGNTEDALRWLHYEPRQARWMRRSPPTPTMRQVR